MFQEFFEKVAQVKNGVTPQPDAVTCQATCIYKAIGEVQPIASIRNELIAGGKEAGDPYNMGRILERYLDDRYIFDENANLSEIRDWLKSGEFLITHGWFTGSGHVIGLDGVAIDTKTLSYKISVKDPWGEFDFKSWRYLPHTQSFDGYYSSHGMYASCVAGQSVSDARSLYRQGILDSMHKGAWVHRILPG
ncbi:MAG: hypothetical protein ACRC80_08620 [Waterburya sp.]